MSWRRRIARYLVRWVVRKYGIWNVLDWLDDDAGDISTWAADYWGRHGDDEIYNDDRSF